MRDLLRNGAVLTHPFVIGELACGSIARRRDTLELLGRLPSAPVAEHHEVVAMVDARRLHGRGIGWIGAHLLASAILSKVPLYTLDARLAAVAARVYHSR